MDVFVFKLNGWNDTFDERVRALANSTGPVTVFRSAPIEMESTDLGRREDITIVDIYPRRGNYVQPSWLKPFFFVTHVVLAVALALWTIFRRRKKPDVVHALDYILGGLAAMLVATVTRVPLVVSVRGLKEPTYQNVAEDGGIAATVSYRILLLLSGLIVPRADHVLTKATYQQDFVWEQFGSELPASTVPTGVDFQKFDPADIKHEFDFDRLFESGAIDSERDTVLLFLGKFVRRKGFDRLMELLGASSDRLPSNLKVVCVGEFRSEAFEKEVRALARSLKDMVYIYDETLPFNQVPKLIATVDGIVLLSEPKNEGIPRVLQEGYVMRTPLIASDVAGIRGAFDDLPGCLLVDRDDPDSFIEAIERIADGELEVDRDEARDRFDLYDNYGRYAEIYEELEA